MKKLALIYLLIAWLDANAQTTTWTWAKRAGGNSDQEGKSVAIDASGNVYVTGYLSGTTDDFDTSTVTVAGGHDLFIAKYTSAGNLVWVKSAGASGFEEGLGIAVDGSGNIFVCGYFELTITFQGPSPVSLTSSGGKDIFIAKFDNNGDIQWAKKAGGTSDDAATSICTNGSYLFVTGNFKGTSTFGPGTLTSSGAKDIFIACYGAVTGTFNWALKAGSSSDDSGEGIALDGNYIYATGTYSNTCSFANLTGALTTAGGDDAFIVKYDIYGYGVWKTSAGGSNIDAGHGIAIDYPNLYVTGQFKGTTNFYDPSASIAATLTSATGDDAFIAKYDAVTGNPAWVNSENGNDDEYGYAVTVDPSGNIWTTGEFKGTLPLGAGPSITASDRDIFLISRDPSGNILSGVRAGGSNIDMGLGVAASGSAAYVTGYFKSVPANFATTSISTLGNKDIFIARYGCQASGGTTTASVSSVCAGGAVTLTLTNYSGTIQWQSSPASSNSWSNIPGATSPSLNVNPTASTDYRALVTQSSCGTGPSSVTTVTILPSPQLTVTSGNTTICAGDSAPLAVTGAASYTWSPSTGLSSTTGNNVNAAPASTTTYTITAASSSGCPATATITVNVNQVPAVSATPSSTSICSGSQTTLLASGALSYTWQPATGLNATTGGLVIASPTISTTYTITGTSNGCMATATAAVTVDSPILFNTITGNQDICNGGQPAQLTGSNVSGGNGIYIYLWQESNDMIIWQPAVGINSLIDYAPPQLTDTTYYRRMVSSGACIINFTSVSDTVTVRILPAITGNSISSDQTMCSGTTPVSLTGSSPSGGNGTYNYLWMESTDGNSWAPASGVNNAATYSPPAPVDTIYYLRTISSGVCSGNYASSSNNVAMNVHPAITGNSISSSQAICMNSTPVPLSGGTPSGGDGSYNYLWEESNDGANWNPAQGASTQQSYTPGSLNTETWYRRTVTSGMCSSTSSPVTINVHPVPSASLAGNDTICSGDNASLNVQLTGVSPWSLTYSDGSQSYTVNGITSSPYTLSIAASTTSAYTPTAVNDDIGCAGTSSGSANVTVYQKPVASAGNDEGVCGLEAVLPATPSTFSGMWTSSPGVLFGDPADPHTTVTLPAYGTYTFTWTETNGICIDQDDVSITAYEPLQATNAGADQDIYFSDQAVLDAAAPTPGTGTWSIVSGSGSISDPSSPTSIVTGMNSGDIVLQWTVTNGACGSVSDDVVLHMHNVIVPTGFSPNSDNTNDVFFIQGIENFSSSLTVFDRWGNEVYKASPYTNSWNGTNMKGEELSDDTYYYVLNVGDKSFTNYVVIKRK